MSIDGTNTPGDSKFWLNIAAEDIYNSPLRLEEAIKKLLGIITWTFGLFATGTGGVLLLFGGISNFYPLTLVAFGLAFFFLCLSYYYSNTAYFPEKKEYTPADVNDIRRVITASNLSRIRLFEKASLLTAAGIFFLASGIMIQFWSLADVKRKEARSYSLHVSVVKKDSYTDIPVSIMCSKNQNVELLFLSGNTVNNTRKILYSRWFTADSIGRLYFSQRFETDSLKNVIVQAVFTEIKNNPDELPDQTIKSIKLNINK